MLYWSNQIYWFIKIWNSALYFSIMVMYKYGFTWLYIYIIARDCAQCWQIKTLWNNLILFLRQHSQMSFMTLLLSCLFIWYTNPNTDVMFVYFTLLKCSSCKSTAHKHCSVWNKRVWFPAVAYYQRFLGQSMFNVSFYVTVITTVSPIIILHFVRKLDSIIS